MLGPVINPEYSWLRGNLDGIGMIQVILIVMDYLKTSALIITMTGPHFQATLQKELFCRSRKGKHVF